MKENRGTEAASGEQDLQAVVAAFQSWRAGRTIGQRIPAELWQAAMSLHPRYSVYRIARALGLDSGDLRDRVGLKPTKGKNLKGAQFVQLPVAMGGGVADCRVKASDGRRVRIAMRLSGCGTEAVMEVLRQLWSRGA